MHFSSVFTREDTSSIPVPETKFKGSEGERLGQLVVTPEVVVSKINNMKENKSPGVDGISPKILKETVVQISPPPAHLFKGALYIIQILCRRYTFWSYPAGLTIADPPG